MNDQHTAITPRLLSVFAIHVFLALLVGCIAHGDYIHLCEFEGTVVDVSSSRPLPNASVFLTTNESSAWDRAKMRSAKTDSQGRFAVETTIGGGSVTWVLFVPIVRGDHSPPVVKRVYIEVEAENRTGHIEVAVPKGAQRRTDAGRSAINLGTLNLELAGRVRRADLTGDTDDH